MAGPHLGASPYRKATLLGQTLRAGVRLLERIGDTPGGESYRGEYPTGLQVTVLVFGTAPGSLELAALLHRLRQIVENQHPNLAAIHDLGEAPDGRIYVVAESLDGELLSEALARRGALPWRKALELFRQVAAGLEAAHAAGWIHGNLSPETILLSRTGERTLVKVIRFSPQSLVGQQAEPPVERDGSVQYASPERLDGREIDERSDVYSLGAVLHHLLTGFPPPRHGGEQAGTIAPALQDVRVPERIRPVLDRALDPSPAGRYQTVAEFVAAIASPEDRIVHLIPERLRRAGRILFRFGAAAAALVALSAGVWLLWGTLTLPDLTGPRAQESGAVADTESQSASSSQAASSESLAPARRLADSLSGSPAQRGPAASTPMLVDVRSIDSSIQIDLRYATANNFTGAPLPGYEATRALLRPEAAAALGRVQAKLRRQGLGLRIFDAYRPVRASRAMVDWAERTGRNALLESGYIARRSRHNLGVSVDLTMVDLRTSTEVPMGSAFDNFTADAQPDHASGEALRYRQILTEAMGSEGFTPYGRAWWHFNYPLEGAVPLDRVIR